VHLDGYIARRRLLAEEATADVEGPGIGITTLSKHHHTLLVEAVSARQAILSSPAQAAQTRATALHVRPPVVEARKAVSVAVHRCLSADKLLQVASQMRLDHGDEAAPLNVIRLRRGSSASLTYLEQRGPVQRFENVLVVGTLFASQHALGVKSRERKVERMGENGRMARTVRTGRIAVKQQRRSYHGRCELY